MDKFVCKSRVTKNVFCIGSDAECHGVAARMNWEYQTDEYIVEPYDESKVWRMFGWPSQGD